MVANEPEDTLELQKRKEARKTRSSGTTTLDLDASQFAMVKEEHHGDSQFANHVDRKTSRERAVG